jgi:hypothetical protein
VVLVEVVERVDAERFDLPFQLICAIRLSRGIDSRLLL